MGNSKNHTTFLTGATGLLGGHMLIQLLQQGKKVRCLIRSTSSLSQLERICSFYGESFAQVRDTVEWVHGDTLDYMSLCEGITGSAEVYHCAAIVSFNNRQRNEMIRTNVQGTANMVDAALKAGVSRFCFISSIAALGSQTDGTPVKEDTPRNQEGAVSGYSESKFRSELEVWRGISEGLNAVIVNPGVILGPGDPDKGSLLIVRTGRKGIPFYTKATTGYVDVRDVCKASIGLMGKGLFNRRYILVAENAHNGRVLGLIAREYGMKEPRFHAGKALLLLGSAASGILGLFNDRIPQLSMDTIRSIQFPQSYSNERISEDLGFHFRTLEETIKETCDFLKSEGL